MDVRREEDEHDLKARYLLFGVVAYAAGRLGKEPVRGQGHVHAIAPHSGWSPPELYEIWEGTAIIYAQRFTADDPGRCIAVTAGPGEKVVTPPGWAHAVINADTEQQMVFGAWCDRQYGFDYTGVRAHGGLAYFPIISAEGAIEWAANHRYHAADSSSGRLAAIRSWDSIRSRQSMPSTANVLNLSSGLRSRNALPTCGQCLNPRREVISEGVRT